MSNSDKSALREQVGGNHYKSMLIQPAEFAYANGLGALEHQAIGYVTRWRAKGGLESLEKAVHTLQLLIELERKYGTVTKPTDIRPTDGRPAPALRP